MDKQERNKIVNAIIFPALFVGLLSLIHLVQFVFEVDFHRYGLYPRSVDGLIGLFTSPFIHGDFQHLLNNSIPLMVLGTALFYFYKNIALKVFLWIFFMSGVWTWVSAREAYHIGASGVLYGMFSFLLFSGFIRRNMQLVALSFFVVLVYGGMVWGIFPIKVAVSYEAHFWGFISGIVLGMYFQNQGPKREEFYWDDDDDIDGDEYWKEVDGGI